MNGSGFEFIKNSLQNIHHNAQKPGVMTESGARNSMSDIKKAAMEMEAMFVYELIKVMRETTDGISSENKGLGGETYMGLFDMEVSKVIAEKSIGIQDAIAQWHDRSSHNQKSDNHNEKITLKKM